jgi:maleylacetate reductase
VGAAKTIEPFVYEGRPQRIIFGPGRLAEAPDVVRALGSSRALVLSTPEQKQAGERVVAVLENIAAGLFAGAVMHTPVEVTEHAVGLYKELNADCVVSVGGGSTTGLGKAIALRTDALQVVIPTTYAGSEVTNLLGETARGEKKTQRSPKILPEAVIYDVELTLSLPPKLSATSGMNAMAHAVEALYATDRNPITSWMAEEGLRAFASSLLPIVENPRDRDTRTNAQYGAWLCGMCLANTTIALHHKLCHVLGGTFDLPHAETHAIVLPHAVAYNAPATPEAMRRIASALGVADAATGLYELVKSLKIPLALKDIGMPAEGIERVVELALKDPYWNPRPLEAEGIRALLRHAYEGAPPAP